MIFQHERKCTDVQILITNKNNNMLYINIILQKKIIIWEQGSFLPTVNKIREYNNVIEL